MSYEEQGHYSSEDGPPSLQTSSTSDDHPFKELLHAIIAC